MTTEQEQLEAQSRAAIKAWCDDPSVEIEFMIKDGSEWISKRTYGWFDLESYYYRIAKPRKWYRVGKDKYDTLFIVQDESEELKYEAMPLFKCWLPEGRKYYD